jgi:DNA-binding SARP family transcriptional activator
MDFLVLGPLEVHAAAGKLPLGGAKQRALLAMLLLRANEAVSSERLVEELWPGSDPADGAKALQVSVSRLRKVLEPDRAPGRPGELLVTRPPGYELRVGAEQLDLHRFERLVDGARRALAAEDAAGAVQRLDEALALWRGEPLADLTYEPFAQGEIARLAELRVAAQEDRLRAELELGRHAEVVGEAERLVADHPLRERPRGVLMLALYRSGRQAEALEAYAAARRALVDELGIEPGRELQELQRAVLAQDPLLDPPAVPGPSAGSRAGPAALVGRTRELGELSSVIERTLANHGGLVLVAGEPGIGKSTLAGELAARARASGAHVIWGRCWEAGGAPAYWPWVQALRTYTQEAQPAALREQLGARAGELLTLMPDLHELFPDLAPAADLESEGARFRLFDAAARFLQRAAATRPLVLVLDDLHAADEPSLLLLRFVARELRDSRLLVIGLYRDIDPIVSDALAATLVELAREPETLHVRLLGLSPQDVGEYIEISTGLTPAAEVVQVVHRETEGNPLFVSEVVRLLCAEGGLEDAGVRVRVPPSVRSVIAQRVARLSGRCRDLLELACVLGREFDLEVLSRLGGLPTDELLEILDEAMAERVVGESPASSGRLRFEHALIRDTLYDELTAARRLGAHRRAGEALEAAYAGDVEPHLAELALHFVAAAPSGTAAKALDYAQRAGDRAESQLAFEEATRHYELALTLIEDRRARCELLLRLGEARARAGDTPAATEAFVAAADLADSIGSPEQLARAAMGCGGRLLWEVSRGEQDVVPLMERALAALANEDSPLRVQLLSRLAAGPLRDARFPPERREARGREALEMARRLDDPQALTYGLTAYIQARLSPPNAHENLRLGRELVDAASRADDKERALEGHEIVLDTLWELGDLDGARAAQEEMEALAREIRQPSHSWLVAVYRSMFALLEGRLEEAQGLIDDARAVGERAHRWNAIVTQRLQRYVLRWEQGRLDELEQEVRDSVAEYPTYPLWRCVVTHMTAELGATDETLGLLAELGVEGFAFLPFDEEWLVGMGLLAEAARSVGDVATGSALYELLLPWADRVTISYPEISVGPVSRYLGLLAGLIGRPDAAATHLEDALTACTRIGARPALARAELDYAALLLERGGDVGGSRAQGLLDDALATARALGMPRIAHAASALA